MSAVPFQRGRQYPEFQAIQAALPDQIYHSAREITEANAPPYLKRKVVGAYRVRVGVHSEFPNDPCVVLPLYNAAAQITNIQFIFGKPIQRPDGETDKLFIGKLQKKGRFCPIGPDLWSEECSDTVIIAEGYATAATCYEATGNTTVVALDAGNLKYVAEVVRSIIGPRRRILIAADNDHLTGGAGETAASEAIYRCGSGSYVLPPFTLEEKQIHGKGISDFNDLARIRSLDSVRMALLNEEAWVRSSDRPRVTIREGNESVSVSEIAGYMSVPKPNGSSEGPYRSSSTLVYVFGGKLKAYDATYFQQVISERVDIWKSLKNTQKPTTVPDALLKMLLKPENTLGYKTLSSVIAAPAALRPDGSLAVNAGYDPELGIYLVRGGLDEPDWSMEDLPTLEECKATLWAFYKDFRVKDDFHRVLLISHLLTILTAHLTPMRPAYLMNASEAGMGKSTAARVNFIIAGVEPPGSPTPPLRWMDGDEYKLEQEVAAGLREGKYPYFDNIKSKSTIDQACFARWTMNETVFFRLLAKTEGVTLQNSWVFTLTGNNIDVAGDMARRVVSVDFSGKNVIEDGTFTVEDPLAYCHKHRAELLKAALGLLSHCLRAGAGSAGDGEGSGVAKIGYPEWRRIVAAPLMRVFGTDISASIRDHYVEAQSDDPDRLAVLALTKLLEIGRDYRAKEIAELLNIYSKEGNEVADLLGYAGRERVNIAANSVGSRIKKLRGKKTPDNGVTLMYEHLKAENIYVVRLAPGSPGEKTPG